MLSFGSTSKILRNMATRFEWVLVFSQMSRVGSGSTVLQTKLARFVQDPTHVSCAVLRDARSAWFSHVTSGLSHVWSTFDAYVKGTLHLYLKKT